MSRNPKDLVALVVDCGPNMRQEYRNGQTYMDLVKTCLTHIIEQKIFCQSKFEYILIGLGIDDSKNAEKCEYPFVARLSDLGVANLKLLKTIKSLEATDNVGKLIDVLSFAAELMHTLPNPKTKYERKKIGLFTNFSFTIDGPEAILYSCNIGKPRELYLNVVCRYTFDELSAKRNLFPCHDHFLQLLINLDNLTSVFTFDFAVTSLPYFEPSAQNAAPWYTRICVGQDLMFPVTGYIKTTEHKKQTWSKAYIEPSEKDSQYEPSEDRESQAHHQASIPLSRNVNYKTSDESMIELEKDEIAKAYLLGKIIVPVTPEDEEAMKFQSFWPPAVRVLFWTPQDNIRQFFFTGSRSMIFIPDIRARDFAPSIAFNVLTHAMLDSKSVAIVSMMRTIRCNPQIGCLTPCYMGDSLVLIYNQLPFAEDIRRYTFPPLIDEKERPQDVPTNGELDLVDDLIKMMSLVEKDPAGNIVEYLNCEAVHDPFDRIQFKAIVHRYLTPNVPLPKEIIEDQTLTTPPHILKRCEGVFRNIKEKFKLVETLKRFSSQQNTNNIFSPQKKIKSENDLDTLTELSLNKGLIESGNKSSQELDSTTMEMFTIFTKQLNELAKDLLGFNDGKIIKIIAEFRNKSIEFNAPYVFNQFMMSYKQKISHKSVWRLIVKKQITLVSNKESSASEIFPDEAMQFIK